MSPDPIDDLDAFIDRHNKLEELKKYAEENGYDATEISLETPFEPTFKRTQETVDYTPDTTTSVDWEAVRDECVSGGAMDERCNIVRSALTGGGLDVVAKRLSCGCILVRSDTDEVF